MENKLNSTEKINPIKTPKLELIKSRTGILGLDDITYGGIPKNRPTLLVGPIGSGKTVIALEYIINGIVMFNEPGVFMTFEEKADELLVNSATLGYDLGTLIDEKKVYLEHLHIDHNEIQETGKYNIEGLFLRLGQAIDKVKAKRVALDSLDTLFSGLDSMILRTEFKRLFSYLKEKNVTAIITAETGDNYLTRMGLEEAIADCVIELNNRVTNQIATRRLRIVKYRGSYHSINEYPFIIDQKGVTIFPMISETPQEKVSTERISTGNKKLDEMLDKKGFYVGSSVLVAGSAGTGKTSIVASFAYNVCSNNQRCLFCAFEEAPNQILRNMESIGFPLAPFVKSDNLRFYFSRPTLQNLELHFLAIKKLIADFKPSVIILDPITNFMVENINSEIRTMFTRFVDYVKTEQITIMFTSAITLKSMEIYPNFEGISSMVDTCIMTQENNSDGIRHRRLFILKSRGINNSKEEVEFIISTEGIKLAPIPMNVPGENESLKKTERKNKEKEHFSPPKKLNTEVEIAMLSE